MLPSYYQQLNLLPMAVLSIKIVHVGKNCNLTILFTVSAAQLYFLTLSA
jgi:hypothetical protein